MKIVNNGMKKTVTKRKIYQKRRKKEKLQKRKNQTQQSTVCYGATQAEITAKKNNNYKHQYKRQPRNLMTSNTCTSCCATGHSYIMNNNQHYIDQSPFIGYMDGIWKWWQTYNTAMEYHNNQARQLSTVGSTEEETQTELLERYALEYETSSEEEDEDDDDAETVREVAGCDQQHSVHSDAEQEDNVDLEYIKFMEITYRHREELKLQRAAENLD